MIDKFEEFDIKVNELWEDAPEEPYICDCGQGPEYEYFYSKVTFDVKIRPKGDIGMISFRCEGCNDVLPEYEAKS
jgi:hypothetical protein